MTGRRWRGRGLVGEALRNLIFAWPRSIGMVVLAAVLLGTLAYVEFSYAQRLITEHRDLVAQGRNVLVVRANGGLDAGRCDALAGVAGVLASGGIRPEGVVSLRHAPGTRFQLAAISDGAVSVIDPVRSKPVQRTTGWTLGAAAAAELGVGPGAVLTPTDMPPAPVSNILSADSRFPELARSIIGIVAPSGVFEECWTEFMPGALAGGEGMLRYWFREADQLDVDGALPLNEFSRDLSAEFALRAVRYLWIVVAAVVFVLAGVVTWLRRTELALYRALGVSSAGLHLLAAVDAIVVFAVALVVGLGVAMVLHLTIAVEWTAEVLATGLRSSVSATVLAAILAPLWIHVTSRTPIADALKDR